MDRCEQCQAKGNMKICKQQNCSFHHLWYTQELLKQIEKDKQAINIILERIQNQPTEFAKLVDEHFWDLV